MRTTQWLATAAIAMFAVPAFAQTTTKPAKAEMKQEKEVKHETKAAKKDEKKEASAEHKAFASATAAPKKWLEGVKPTKAEKTQITAIEKKYDDQITVIRKDYDKTEKAKQPADPQTVSKVQALVEQEKAEIRALLTPTQQAKFDANVAKVK